MIPLQKNTEAVRQRRLKIRATTAERLQGSTPDVEILIETFVEAREDGLPPDEALEHAWDAIPESRHPGDIASDIHDWDLVNVRELGALLAELDNACSDRGDHADNWIDHSSLPSAEIPEDIDTAYPVWAMDQDDDCLVEWGASGCSVSSLEDIRDAQHGDDCTCEYCD